MAATFFRCPVCKEQLIDGIADLSCKNGHSFDKSSKGYVHLLLSNKMHAKIPGDNREMVDARRRFLELGYYKPFADTICSILGDELKGIVSPVLLDAGCGEGYYTVAAHNALEISCGAVQTYGFDISKFAVKAAASRSKKLHLAVASCFDIPFANGSADALLAVFSPIVPAEFARVLKRGGIMLLAVAGERHLWGLKQLLYEKPYLNEIKDTEYEGFRFEKRVSIKSDAVLTDNGSIKDLFAMTPYFWKTSAEGSRKINEAQHLKTELGFDFLLYRRI